MVRIRKFLLVFSFVLFSSACGAIPQSISPVQVAPASELPVLQATATPVPTATNTMTLTPSPSETATQPAATIPQFLTLTPGIGATLTAAYSTPGTQSTMAAQQTMAAATEAILMPGLSTTLLSQCPNPSDPPKENWVNIPVMPQATAGQVVETLIGSYYCFRAPVTIADMETFYKEKLSAPNWILQSDVNGSMVFIGMSQAGFQYLFLVSGPGNKNDLIVAINVTISVGIPTPKP
jgi:hypothetical protein